MNINHFKYIVEIAESGSISKAAENLFLSQPYLSRIIKEIEKELSIKIFNRSIDGIHLTPSGVDFLNKAKVILEQYTELLHINDELMKEKQNNITISTIRSSLVMEAFIELVEAYYNTNYKFTINEHSSDQPIHDIAYMKADLGVIYLHKHNKENLFKVFQKNNIIYEKICDFKIYVILGVNHPLTKKNSIKYSDLENYGLVTYSDQNLPYQKDSSRHNYLDSIMQSNIHNKTIYVNSRASLHNILTQTNFFSIGTEPAVNQEKKFQITSVPIEGLSHISEIEMGVIYRKTTNLHNIAYKFVDILKSHYGLLDKN